MDVRNLGRWFVTNREVAFDLVRIYIGLALLVRGFVFGTNPAAYYGLVDMVDPAFSAMTFAHYVALAHISGGLLLMVGLLTRVAALIQVPILIGAVFFVHAGESLADPTQGLELAALVLVLLLAYVVYGSGPLSLDHYFLVTRVQEREREEDALIERRLSESRSRAESNLRDPIAPGRRDRWQPCTHGRSRRHPRVKVERHFGRGRRLRLLTGASPAPTRIVFRCIDCHGVAEVSTLPQDLAYYRTHSERPAEVEGETVE